MVDFTKPVQTRDGQAVRILCTDGPGHQPVIGLLGGALRRWCANGEYYIEGTGNRPDDLVNAPEERWMVVYVYNHVPEKWYNRFFQSENEARDFRKKIFDLSNRKIITIQKVQA